MRKRPVTDPAADEAALVRRYVKDRWTIAKCGRRFGIGYDRAKTILKKHNVELRGQPKTELDPDAVVRAYERLGSYTHVAVLLGVDDSRVKAILVERGITPSTTRMS